MPSEYSSLKYVSGIGRLLLIPLNQAEDGSERKCPKIKSILEAIRIHSVSAHPIPVINIHMGQGSTFSIQSLQFKAYARPHGSNFGCAETGHVDRSHPLNDLLNERCLAHSGFPRNQCLGMSQPHRAIFFNIGLI